MSDVDLPLWNKGETDVLPEFQLSFGHVLTCAAIDDGSVITLGRTLGLGKRQYVGPIDANRFPRDTSGKYRNLGTPKNAHLLTVDLGHCHALFGPHTVFFHNRNWISWNAKLRALMAVATRQDVLETSYRVFRGGNYQTSAWLDPEKLWFPEIPDIEVYVNGEEVFRSSENQIQNIEEIVSLLRADVELRDDDGTVTVQRRFQREQVPLSRATHHVFGSSQ